MSAAELHVAELIRTAASAEERARILLRVPDALLLQKTADILCACFDVQFLLGLQFVEARVAAMCAMRGPGGKLPEGPAAQVEFYRGLMSGLGGVTP